MKRNEMKEAKAGIRRAYRIDETEYVVTVDPYEHEVEVEVYTYFMSGKYGYYVDSWVAYLPPRSKYALVVKSRWSDGRATGYEGSRCISRIKPWDFHNLVAKVIEGLNKLGDDNPALVKFARGIVRSMGDKFVGEENENFAKRS